MDPEYNILGGYLPSFIQHLKDTRGRLGLRTTSPTNVDGISSDGNVGESTGHQTTTQWSPAEQCAFFRAVSVHSRWRPDLIAACVPTKTECEVWMYLEALEEGVAMLRGDVNMSDGEGNDVEMQVDGSPVDARSHSVSDMDGDEDLCKPALEVSQDWIDVEERMASWIIDQEHLVSLGNDVATDVGVDDKLPKRKRGRPRATGKERSQSLGREQTISSKGSSPPPDHAFEPCRDSSAELTQQRDALMGRLGVSHLLVLDSILREGEEAMKEKSKSRDGSIIGDDGSFCARDPSMSGLSERITGTVPGPSANVVTDPVLLGLSRAADLASNRSSQGPSTTSRGTQSLPPMPDGLSQAGSSQMFVFPQDDGALANRSPSASAETDLSLFSPRSRRRIQKRLYMRRKRASLRENGAATESVTDTRIEKLKPGKKAKKAQSETLDGPSSGAPSDVEDELEENMPKKNKGGMTLPYKLRAQFVELGIDAVYLRDQGMDLLNLGALGRLMRLWSSLEHSEEGIAESIDAEFIRHLQAGMVAFVTDLIHRAIVWREREIRLKQRSRAWRQGEQITIGAVEHAVEAIGSRYRSHKAYFSSLEALHGPAAEASSAPGNAAEDSDSRDDPDVEAADMTSVLSPHREVYTPLVCPPSAWGMRPLGCLTWTYEQEAMRTRRGASADVEETALMSDETDEEALAGETVDSEDERDRTLGSEMERDLWDSVMIR